VGRRCYLGRLNYNMKHKFETSAIKWEDASFQWVGSGIKIPVYFRQTHSNIESNSANSSVGVNNSTNSNIQILSSRSNPLV